MEFRILGPLEVAHQGRSLDLGRPKQRALLALLLLHRNQVVPIEYVIENLWNEPPPTAAGATLQAHVSRLRRVLGDACPNGRSMIVTRKPGYMMSTDSGDVDADRFQSLMAEARYALSQGCADVAADALTSALSLWRGRALAELSLGSSASAEITRLEDLRLAAIEDLMEAKLAMGHHREVLSEMDAVIAQNPLREGLWAHRMVALYRSGRQAEALRSYQELRRLLADQLGIDPSPELKRLEEAILLQKPEVAASPRSTASIPVGSSAIERTGPGTNLDLPLPLTRFIGREKQRLEIRARLSETRLLTLTGVGGCGKTRLALQTALEMDPRPEDGIALAELSPVADPALVPRVVASAVGMREEPGARLDETLISALRPKKMLLILDNCEHLLGACAELASLLLRSCEHLVIIATSRQPLGLPGELVWPVPALSLPPHHPGASLEATATSEAVQLFVDRARLVRPEFELTPENAAAVVGTCRRLDGIALAIELAASRVGALSPAEIEARLDDRFHLLTGGSETLPPRQQSLRAAVEWSHDLLWPAERAVLRRLSVFPAGCTLAAAEQVCTGSHVEATQILDLLASLVSKSLLVADVSNERTRYRLLETIRQFGAERLCEAGEASDAQRRHARWCVSLAERAERELTGPSQHPWLACLEAEHDSLRAALMWAVADGEPEMGLRLAGALTLFWRVRGYFGEGREWLESALGAGLGAPASQRAKALWGAGFMSLMLGDYAAAISRLDESLAISREIGDWKGAARSLLLIGNCRQFTNGQSMALVFLEGSVELARDVADAWCLSHGLALCGWAHLDQGDTQGARSLLDESLAVAREASDEQGLRVALTLRGRLALIEGDLDLAEALLGEALAVSRQLDEGYAVIAASELLGELAAARGDYVRARQLLQGAVSLARHLAIPTAVVDSLCSLGELAVGMGTADDAHQLLIEADAQARAAGMTSARCLRGLGELCLLRGDPAGAQAHLVEALALNEASGDNREQGLVLYNLAKLTRSEGEDERASSLHRRALSLFSQLGHVPLVARSLEALAGPMAARGQCEAAAVLMAAAQSFRTASGYARLPAEGGDHERDMALIRGRLDEEQLDSAWRRGTAMSLDEAVQSTPE